MIKKIGIVSLTILVSIISYVFILATPAYALENTNRWTLDEDGYHYYNWTESYVIENQDFHDYTFEYFVTGQSWKALVPSEDSVIKLEEISGHNHITRFIYIDDQLIASGTQGTYGDPVVVLFRYTEASVQVGDWILNEDGYYYYNNSFAQNQYTAVNIDNQMQQLIEYRIKDLNRPNNTTEWRAINLNAQSKIFVRNYAQGYSSSDNLIILDGTEERLLATAARVRNIDNSTTNQVLDIRFKEIEISDLTPVNLLPETAGSIFDNKMEMGSVRFIASGYNLTIAITYNGLVYYMQYAFNSNQDMSIFNNGYETYYYTTKDDKGNVERFIMINQGSESMFTSKDVRKQTFIPYMVWNLTTDEIETIERFNTYIYTKKEAGNNVYAYFYVDEYVIDELLSVSLAYKYRFVKTFGGYTDWEENYMILEAGETEKVSPVTWQGKLIAGTTTAMTVGAFIPGVRWPVLAIGTAVLAFTGSQTDVAPFAYSSISQIKEADLAPSEASEIEAAFLKHDHDFNFDPNLKVFKLHLGQFDKFLTSGIDIDTEYSVVDGQHGINIIQFTYRTEGEVYTIAGKNINVIFERGPGTDGKPTGINLRGTAVTIAIIVIVVAVGFSAYKTNAFASPKKALGFIVGTLLILGVIIAIYIALTSGILDTLIVVLRL